MSRQKTRVSALLQRGFPAAVLALALLAVPIMIWGSAGLPRLNDLREEREKLKLEASKLKQSIAQLRSEVDRAKADPGAIERTARDELGLVRRSEIVFQFDK